MKISGTCKIKSDKIYGSHDSIMFSHITITTFPANISISSRTTIRYSQVLRLRNKAGKEPN